MSRVWQSRLQNLNYKRVRTESVKQMNCYPHSSKWRSYLNVFGSCLAPNMSPRRTHSIKELWACLDRDCQERILCKAFAERTPKETAELRLVCRQWRDFGSETIIFLAPKELHPIKLPGAFPNLNSLDLTRLNSIEDRFHVLLKVRNLTSLYLRSLDDEGMEVFTQLTNLRALDLAGAAVSDGNLTKLCSSLEKLELLNLKQCTSMTQRGINALSVLKSLKYLSLESALNEIGGVDLHPLLCLTNLELLNIGNYEVISDRVLKVVGQLHSLRQLYALLRADQRNKSSDTGITALLGGLTNLQVLSMSLGLWYTPRSFDEITRLSQLEKLTLTKMEYAREWIFPKLAQVPSLQQLELDGCGQFEEEQLLHLTALVQLSSLVLSAGERPRFPRTLHDSVLVLLSALTTLRALTINGYYGLTGSTIYKLNSLTALNLIGCRHVRDCDFTALEQLSNLKTLSHKSCERLTDDSFTSIALISKLHSLSVSNNSKILGLNLAVLSRLTGLRKLELKRCSELQDEGVQQLAKITSLQRIDCRQSRAFTESGVKALRKANPNLELRIPYRFE